MQEILIICLIGAIAGWIAGAIVNADSGSFLLDIVIGIIGGYLGYRLFGHMLNITSNVWVNMVITASAGAVIVALLLKMVRMLFSDRRAI
ncbi:MAG: GlsB/YeaQ/YmgE family stress response membrane protein [Taibaiella sp.]|nr:GlsB/YeaQ/YmgE family stress response membrane protein [Taibaiella sp.]